ncbi:cytochrome c [Massilia sp. TW-1]|uniref:Cytochrome c n=1 Tax=Telluria antibiotica TaxID=2717319 RepID=A0ABX0P9L3_9BURK|nr:cytochrome c [Telluria antibiotica]NIA53990.1 cytochrome c [Telluria antibiotica]
MTPRHVIAAVLAASAALGHAEPMDGKSLFAKNCAACHQPTGRGIPGAFPALAGNAFVQGDPAAVATVLLKGRGGMPDFSGSLDDGEIALVLTHVRTSWGNDAPPVTEQDVAGTRAALGVAPASHDRFGNKH